MLGGIKVKEPLMEKKIFDWYWELHVFKSLLVTSRMVKSKALELSKLDDFSASNGWYNKYKKKYHLNISRHIS